MPTLIGPHTRTRTHAHTHERARAHTHAGNNTSDEPRAYPADTFPSGLKAFHETVGKDKVAWAHNPKPDPNPDPDPNLNPNPNTLTLTLCRLGRAHVRGGLLEELQALRRVGE